MDASGQTSHSGPCMRINCAANLPASVQQCRCPITIRIVRPIAYLCNCVKCLVEALFGFLRPPLGGIFISALRGECLIRRFAPQRRMHLAHAIVEAKPLVREPCIALAALVAKRSARGREGVVIGDDHPALAGGDLLAGMKSEQASP